MPEPQSASATAPLPTGKPTVPSRPATGTDTVTVACKIANGLILEVSEMVDWPEPNGFGGGTRTTKKAVRIGEQIVIRGNAIDIVNLRSGADSEFPRVGGYALTSGVPRDFWELWLEQHKDAPYVKNGLVFAHTSIDGTSGEAREKKAVESGFEGIDPDNPQKKTGIRGVAKGERAPR